MYDFIKTFLRSSQLAPSQLLSNGLKCVLSLTLIYRELGVELEMIEFNEAYVVKVNTLTNPRFICLLNKIRRLNVIPPKNHRNWK